MSTFERYDIAAASYDSTRIPIGAGIIAGCLQAARKPMTELALLDAGCGTGAYSEALVDQVGHITALDLSDGMLEVARAKLAQAGAAGRIEFHKGSITAMPFPDESFDGVMFNQVLHHLEDGRDRDYGATARAIAEAHRVLRPGGLVVINACSHEQLRAGYWYYQLIPSALASVLQRCAPSERLIAALRAVGFAFHDRIVAHEAVMQGPAYFDGEGPLDPAWRKGDSIWSLATSSEIGNAERRIRDLAAVGGLQAFVAEHDRLRPSLGQFSFFLGSRSMA